MRRNKNIVALARKILGILWHLLVHQEPCIEPRRQENRKLSIRAQLPKISIDDAVELLLNVGYRTYSPGSQKAAGKGVRKESGHTFSLIFAYK